MRIDIEEGQRDQLEASIKKRLDEIDGETPKSIRSAKAPKAEKPFKPKQEAVVHISKAALVRALKSWGLGVNH
jgi:hypothetical protein